VIHGSESVYQLEGRKSSERKGLGPFTVNFYPFTTKQVI